MKDFIDRSPSTEEAQPTRDVGKTSWAVCVWALELNTYLYVYRWSSHDRRADSSSYLQGKDTKENSARAEESVDTR